MLLLLPSPGFSLAFSPRALQKKKNRHSTNPRGEGGGWEKGVKGGRAEAGGWGCRKGKEGGGIGEEEAERGRRGGGRGQPRRGGGGGGELGGGKS